MSKFLKWLLPALILINVALVWFEVLDLSDAIFVVVGFEVLALLVGGHQIFAAVRRYRRDRSKGLDLWTALRDGLAVLLPVPLANSAVSELRLFSCLTKWMLRRTQLREGEFSYHKRSTFDMFVLMVVFVTPVEILVIEVLLQAFLPVLWLRILFVVLAVYALFWILGFYASRITLPYRLETEGLRLHHGILAEGFIPYREIAGVERDRRKSPRSGEGLTVQDGEAYLAISGHTDVTVELASPQRLKGLFRLTEPVNSLHLAADEPGRLASELGRRTEEQMRAAPLPESKYKT